MKVKDVKKLENFLEKGQQFPNDAVLYFFLFHLMFAIASVGLVYELKYAIINIPFVFISSLIYIFSKKQNTLKSKKAAIGIIGIIASLNCQIICLFFIRMKIKQILLLETILLLTNLCVVIAMMIVTKIVINNEKSTPKTKYASSAIIVPFAIAGVMTSRYLTADSEKKMLIFGFILISYVFSTFILFLIEWYYIKLFEKIKDTSELAS